MNMAMEVSAARSRRKSDIGISFSLCSFYVRILFLDQEGVLGNG